MAIQNLPEFAKNGQKNTDGLVLLDGFPVNKKPARQWMNFLFNQLTVAINAINAEKLDATTNAVSASKWQTARTINVSGSATGSVSIDGTKDVQLTLTLQNSGVVAGTYGSGLKVPVITTDKAGLNKVILEKDIPIFLGSSLGLVPASSTANKDKFLRGDGAWGIPTNTTYGGMTTNEIDTGTSVSERLISAANLKYAVKSFVPAGSTEEAGVLKLENTLNSTNVDKALTAHQGKILNDQAFGVGQQWVDCAASRVLGTTYTNTTKKSKTISFVGYTAAGVRVSVKISGIELINTYCRDSGIENNVMFIVPAGSTYSISGASGISKWWELG